MSLLRVKEIKTFYGRTQVIFGLSLRVEPGEAVCLLGRNGAAKTTTLRSIMGLTPAQQGQIVYKDEEITREPPHQIVRRGIGYAPQERIIFPDLTVKQNLDLAQRGVDGNRRGRNVEKVYELFPPLEELSSKLGFTLSGGQERMLAVGRALIRNPDLVLLDEPGEGLSPVAVAELGSALRKMRAMGVTLLFAEHNLRFALELSERIYIIERGMVRYQGASSKVRHHPDILRTHLGVAPSRLDGTGH